MQERTDVITMKGAPLTLIGNEVQVDDLAPDFTVLNNNLAEVHLSDYRDKVLVLASVPSLDTSVCDMETRRFNQEASQLSDNVQVLVISTDLPFAQQRWCGAAGIDRVQTLSDHRDVSFGQAYGVLIKELRLLARAVFVVDRDGVIRYTQYVKEQANRTRLRRCYRSRAQCTGVTLQLRSLKRHISENGC